MTVWLLGIRLSRQITRICRRYRAKRQTRWRYRGIPGILRTRRTPDFLEEIAAEGTAQTSGLREVILSGYLVGESSC